MTIVMKPTIAAGVFKAQCLGLLDNVEQQRIEIVITKRGRPVARLVPVVQEAAMLFGRMQGTGRVTGDILSTGESWDVDA